MCVCGHQFTLGGFEELQELKVRGRERLNLAPLPEDSIKVVRAMRAASPPASAMELIEQQQQQKRGRRSRRVTHTRTHTHSHRPRRSALPLAVTHTFGGVSVKAS